MNSNYSKCIDKIKSQYMQECKNRHTQTPTLVESIDLVKSRAKEA